MAFAQHFLPEFDHEMATTRTLLERVPEDRATWRPHAKSMTLGDLAAHVGTIPGYGTGVITRTEVDMNPPGGPAYTPARFTTKAELLATFDKKVAEARAAIAGAADDAFSVPWSLKSGGQTIFTVPRAGALRTFMMSHIIHHRGQLSVYLRLLDVPLPSIYGPTADTPM
jgi:uncharacterized damage-inducible protein DinB